MAEIQPPTEESHTTPEEYNVTLEILNNFPQIAGLRKFSPQGRKALVFHKEELAEMESKLETGQYAEVISRASGRRAECRCACSTKRESLSPRSLQREAWLEFSKELRRYRSALLQQKEFDKLRPPQWSSFTVFRKILRNSSHLDRGEESQLWDEVHYNDLAAVWEIGDEEHDPFAGWVEGKIRWVLVWFHNTFGVRFRAPHAISKYLRDDPQWGYNPSKPKRIVSICIQIVTCMLPMLSIPALYPVKDTSTKLGLFVGLTFLLASILAIMTPAKTSEIFTVTTALAAVGVALIGPNNYKS